MVRNALITIAILPLVFFACMFLFSNDTHAASNSLKGSITYAKSQSPEIDRSTIRGSIAYAKYQGEIIEQGKFQKVEEVETPVLGEFDTNPAVNLDNTTLPGSIYLARAMPEPDRTTLSGSIMIARSYDRISKR